MADPKTTFILTARDQATASVKRLKGELGALGGTAAKTSGPLGKVTAVTSGFISPAGLAVGGALALGGAMAGAAKAAIEEQKGVALLTTAIKQNDPAMAGNIEKIEETIKERQNLAFADDEQRESLGALVAVTRDSNKALELQRTAMDLARLKGMSLADATNLIGKVYSGNIGILGRYGIQLDKGATATEAIAEIQRRSAGQAEAYAQTTSGALESMGLVFDDVVEDIGAMLLPALTSLALYVRDQLIPAFRDFAETVGPIFEAVGRGVSRAITIADAVLSTFDPAAAFREKAMASIKEQAAATEAAARTAANSVELIAHDGIHRVVQAYQAGGPVVAAEAGKIAGMLPSQISAQVEKIRAAGRENVVQFAAGLLDAQNDPQTAIDAMILAQETALTRSAEIARLKGQLNSKELAAGLNDERDAVSLAAQAAQSEILARLETLGASGYSSGASLMYNVASGISAAKETAKQAARDAGYEIRDVFPFSEPKDPRSPLRGLRKAGAAVVDMLSQGMRDHLRTARGAAGAVAGALAPTVGGTFAPAFAGGAPTTRGGGGTVVINFNSTFPPTPAQGQAIASQIGPELERWRRSHGL